MKQVLRHTVEVIERFPGSDLIGRAYAPLFPDAIDGSGSETAWTILGADWVTTTDGTGVVHTAVMYGEDDYHLGMEAGLPAQHTVGMDGTFLPGVHPDLDGREVKACDERIIEILDGIQGIYREEAYTHDYPPLLANGSPIALLRHGFLVRSNDSCQGSDAGIQRTGGVGSRLGRRGAVRLLAGERQGLGHQSRTILGHAAPSLAERTRCPVHRFDSRIAKQAVEEANARGITNPPCPDDVDLHRPVVDDFVLVDSEGRAMHREPFVMDCWFDSGCASFAQWHHPFDESGRFERSFPVDYICEGVDQTRGWFYTLLAVSTTVFDSMAYRRCLSLGLILDAEGKKMSKSKGNIVDPWDHFNAEGADATRWYMVTAGAPWNPMKFDPNGVRETYAKMFLTLWNVHRFHADYAALDGFDPEAVGTNPVAKDRPELDRWILSRLAMTAHEVHRGFETYEFHKAGRTLEAFLVNDVSNWYVRRSRRRLWDEAPTHDKLACQATLHEVLTTLTIDGTHRTVHVRCHPSEPDRLERASGAVATRDPGSFPGWRRDAPCNRFRG